MCQKPQAKARAAAKAGDCRQAAKTPGSKAASGCEPWADPRWAQYKWTVYRGAAYELSGFIDRHPGGSTLIRLALGRDCTGLVETYHLRPEAAAAMFSGLPQLEGFPVEAVPRAPYPGDSKLYAAVRQRVRDELFSGKRAGAHRQGAGAALLFLAATALAYVAYARWTNVVTGILYGLLCTFVMVTIQHCANHGGMSPSAAVNTLLGFVDDLAGASSLRWRYYHQVSHHIHTNDAELDHDVVSVVPILRLDASHPRFWVHRYQHIYVWLLLPLLAPLAQYGDLLGLITNTTPPTVMHGSTPSEWAAAIVGKAIYTALVLGLPWRLHGAWAAFVGSTAVSMTQSILLLIMFSVSHNVPESRPQPGSSLARLAEQDWGAQQVLASANWGGSLGCFFSGGLNLQIEHHLFPSVSYFHYPAIAGIVREECAKFGVPYTHYPSLPAILARFVKFLRDLGAAKPSSAAQQLGLQEGAAAAHAKCA